METKRQLHSLTSLKGLFILVIIFHNSLSANNLFGAIPGTAFVRLFGGKLGDAMFFTLSGFLFSYSYRERISQGLISFQSYICRRLQKLYPLYIITNALSLVLAIALHGISAMTIQKCVFTLLLQMGGLENDVPYNSPTWFICALFVCYIVFFFIAYYAKKPTQYYSAITFGIIYGYTLANANLTIPFCFPGNGLAFTNFFLGCVLAELYPLIKQKWHIWLRPTSLFILLASFFLFFRYGVEIIAGDFSTACSFVLCPLIIYLALADGWSSRILQWKPFVLLGKISVSLFFWHMVIYTLLSIIVPNGAIQEVHYMLYLLILFMWSFLSYKFIEKGK